MPYTVMINGVPVIAETASEAVALTQEAAASGADSTSKGHRHAPPTGAAGPSRWTEARVKEFFGLIKVQQRKLVDALLETPDARTGDRLCQTLGLKNGAALAGVFTGLFKNAKKVGADPKELYQRQSVTIGDRRQYEYSLTEAFRAAALKWKP